MKEALRKLELIARRLEPNARQRLEIFEHAEVYANRFIDNLSKMKGYQSGKVEALKDFELQENGVPFEGILRVLQTEVDRIGINSAGGTHMGYIPGGGLFTSAIADMLAATANRYAGIAYSCPGAVEIENQLIRWTASLVGYPDTAHGNLTSGGSIASLVAIQAARDHHNVNSTSVKQAVVYITGQVHHCIQKVLKTTGLHECIIRTIAQNDSFQMDTTALHEQVKADIAKGLQPFLVVATAGTTDTGAIDPLDEISDLCEQHDIWFHVDAAYGGFFLLVDDLKERFKGIERSDSLVMDPHKTLFIPYGSGIVMLRDRMKLLSSFSHKANYMQDAYGLDEIDPADSGPELSKHFRGLRMWLPLQLHGLEPFRASLKEKVLLTRYFHEKVQQFGLEAGGEPQLTVSMFRLPGGNAINEQLIQLLHNDGRVFFSSTKIDGKLWIRCAIVSHRTHLREVNLGLHMIEDALIHLHSIR